jgi:S1-C subfamily serine protease
MYTRSIKKIVVVPLFLLPGILLCCVTPAQAEKRLMPINSASSFRISDIEKSVDKDPVRAIHLIGMYRIKYGEESLFPEADSLSGTGDRLSFLEEQALENLKKSQTLAIAEKRFDDAASLARSLAIMGVAVESTGAEPDLILASAKEQLAAGNNLEAFLAAARSHELKPLEADDALVFLEQAVKVKQRRTAAFFYAAAEERLSSSGPEKRGVLDQYRQYVSDQDAASDMVKGVATVVIDRGYRVERGMGLPDRVLGSAFFVDASGLLITNYHVIASEVDPSYEGYSRMFIRMGDSASARIPAKVIGWDKTLDLALIKADIVPEYVFSVTDRIVPRVGDTISAIGSPGGLEKTVTRGIVSALGRRFLQIGDVIQMDAMVNHGNSGGPVIDPEGRLVGIVFAGIEQFPGVNFAVPAERLAAALPAMIKGGKAERPWLGLTISETVQGAEIVYVAPYTPASEQQIPEGAMLEKINGRVINAPQGTLIPAFQDMIFADRPGELVSLETSDGMRRVLMTVARPDLPLAVAARVDTRERLAAPLFGIILSPAIESGAFSSTYQVKKVIRGSIADEAGLSELDPISIRGFRVVEKEGYVLLDINVKKRRMGYLETSMRLPAILDLPDTL